MEGKEPKVLDLGCGTRKRPGSVGIDCNPASKADIIHDLNVTPYPFKSSEFDEIYVDNVLEHLDNVLAVMEELHRISGPGALVKIVVPYFRSRWACIDPTHKHFFTAGSFDYFDENSEISKIYPYSKARFRIEKTVFNENVRHKGLFAIPAGLFKKVADANPVRYETWFSTLFPLDDITFYLRTEKK